MKKIIIVEDDKMLAQVYVSKLRMRGYNAEFIHTEKGAFEKIKAEKPLLVLLDLILPDGDGFEILEKIREDDTTKNTVVFILSKLKSDLEESRSTELKADRFLSKSDFSFNEIIDLIDSSITS